MKENFKISTNFLFLGEKILTQKENVALKVSHAVRSTLASGELYSGILEINRDTVVDIKNINKGWMLNES